MSLQTLYDKLESHLRNLETLAMTTDKCASFLYPMVESSMPEDLLRAWQCSSLHICYSYAKSRLHNLMKFMLLKVESEQRIGLAMSDVGLDTYSHKEGWVEAQTRCMLRRLTFLQQQGLYQLIQIGQK